MSKQPSWKQLDDFIGDIHNKIVDLESHIVRQLEAKLIEKSDVLVFIDSVLSELDWYSNAAKGSSDLTNSSSSFSNSFLSLVTCAKEMNLKRFGPLCARTHFFFSQTTMAGPH